MDKAKLKSNLKKFYFSFIWLIVLIFLLDLITKWVVQNNVAEGSRIWLIPNFLSITLHHNVGASFGIGSDGSTGMRILWICISVILSGALIWFYVYKFKKLSTWYKVAIGLMIAGAVGNMIDRIFYWKAIVNFDGVIDWISFNFGSYQFPFFNIADSALVIGVVIIVILLIIELVQDAIEKNKAGAYSIPPAELEKKQKEEAAKKANEEHKDK